MVMFGVTYCHSCGDEEPEEGHYRECRPDLFPHEVGNNCTWPGDKCYMDHETGKVLDHMKPLANG